MTELLVLNVGRAEMQAVCLDGAQVRTVIRNLHERPDGLVVDQARGHVYWTNMGAPDPGAGPRPEAAFTRNGSLERADLDGGNRMTILPRGSFTCGKQLTADFEAGLLYWCDREGMQVLSANLDGSDLTTLVIAGVGEAAARDARNHCVGIAVDRNRRLLYWTQKGSPKAGQGRIFRAGLDLPPGADAWNRSDVELLWDSLPEPVDLELVNGSLLTWTDRGGGPSGNSLNRASVTPEIAAPEVISLGYSEAIGVAAVSASEYYVGDLGGSVRHIDLEAGADERFTHLGSAITGLAFAEL